MTNDERIQIGNAITIYRRGKKAIYTADFWFQGQHRRRSLGTCNLKVAKARAIKLEAELGAGVLTQSDKGKPIVDALDLYVKHLRTEGRRPKTITKYESFLRVFASFAADWKVSSISDIRPQLVDEFRSLRKENHSIKSMHTEAVILKGFLRWCVQRQLLSSNPMEAMKFKKPVLEPRGGPAPQDVARIIGVADGARKFQLAVLALTGCRSGELQRLQLEDVDIEAGWIRIVSRDGAETKSGYSRKIPIHPVLRRFLEAVPTTVGPWLFCEPASKKYPRGGHQISTKRLNEDFLGLLRKVGLKAGRDGGFTIHSLRHAFETICVNAGIPQRVIDTWLGHRSDGSMASIYYRLTDEESQHFMQQVPFGLSEPAAKAAD